MNPCWELNPIPSSNSINWLTFLSLGKKHKWIFFSTTIGFLKIPRYKIRSSVELILKIGFSNVLFSCCLSKTTSFWKLYFQNYIVLKEQHRNNTKKDKRKVRSLILSSRFSHTSNFLFLSKMYYVIITLKFSPTNFLTVLSIKLV